MEDSISWGSLWRNSLAVGDFWSWRKGVKRNISKSRRCLTLTSSERGLVWKGFTFHFWRCNGKFTSLAGLPNGSFSIFDSRSLDQDLLAFLHHPKDPLHKEIVSFYNFKCIIKFNFTVSLTELNYPRTWFTL